MGPSKYKPYAEGKGSNAYLTSMANIAKKEYKESEPLRQSFLQDWQNIAAGGTPYFEGTMFSGLRRPIEEQYNVAKGNILSSLPQGGALQSELAKAETSRAGGLSSALQNIWMDQLSKAYGYATGAPQIAIQGLGSAGQSLAGIQSSALQSSAQSAGSICCWNYLAAHGSIPEEVRRYRDEFYPKGCAVSKGYKWMSEWFVPLMKIHPRFRKFMDLTTFIPMAKYAQWYYKQNHYGWIFKPIVNFWIDLWKKWSRLPQAKKYYMKEE